MKSHIQLIWDIADILRGPFKPQDFARIVLPFTVLRRVLQALEPQAAAMEAYHQGLVARSLDPETVVKYMGAYARTRAKAQGTVGDASLIWTRLNLPWGTMLQQPKSLRTALGRQVAALSPNLGDVFTRFEFAKTVEALDDKELLYPIVSRLAQVDLSPATVDNAAMGHIFEELIRRFAEQSNETAGEHFTPREVIRLMVDLLFAGLPAKWLGAGTTLDLYDPTAGTGGMLSVAEEHAQTTYPDVALTLSGQEINDQSYAVCKADLILRGHSDSRIHLGDTLVDDRTRGGRFHLMLSNPPFGVDWKKVKAQVEAEHARGRDGRFPAGLPRTNDGQLLFLQHLAVKMHPRMTAGPDGQPAQGEPSRVAVVTSGSPLFSGDAGSGESEIRKWLFEQDLVEAIIALPGDLFYNTGIGTYVWLLSNHKRGGPLEGRVMLINAAGLGSKMRRSLGNKRIELTEADIRAVHQAYLRPDGEAMGTQGTSTSALAVKVLPVTALGFRQIQVDVAQLDAEGQPVWKDKRQTRPAYDASRREWENVPLTETVEEFLSRDVRPHLPEAVVDDPAGVVGYEVNFNEHFFQPPVLPSSADLTRRIQEQEQSIQFLLKQVLGC